MMPGTRVLMFQSTFLMLGLSLGIFSCKTSKKSSSPPPPVETKKEVTTGDADKCLASAEERSGAGLNLAFGPEKPLSQAKIDELSLLAVKARMEEASAGTSLYLAADAAASTGSCTPRFLWVKICDTAGKNCSEDVTVGLDGQVTPNQALVGFPQIEARACVPAICAKSGARASHQFKMPMMRGTARTYATQPLYCGKTVYRNGSSTNKISISGDIAFSAERDPQMIASMQNLKRTNLELVSLNLNLGAQAKPLLAKTDRESASRLETILYDGAANALYWPFLTARYMSDPTVKDTMNTAAQGSEEETATAEPQGLRLAEDQCDVPPVDDPVDPGTDPVPAGTGAVTAEDIQKAVSGVTAPLQEQISAKDTKIADLTKQLDEASKKANTPVATPTPEVIKVAECGMPAEPQPLT